MDETLAFRSDHQGGQCETGQTQGICLAATFLVIQQDEVGLQIQRECDSFSFPGIDGYALTTIMNGRVAENWATRG